MTAPTEIRQRAIALLEQLPGESLIKAVEFLESLSRQALQISETTTNEASETALIQIIQRRFNTARLRKMGSKTKRKVFAGYVREQ